MLAHIIQTETVVGHEIYGNIIPRRVMRGPVCVCMTYRGKCDIEEDGVSEKCSKHDADVVVLEARHAFEFRPFVLRGVT